MVNNKKINPATTGTNDSTAMEMVATYPVDINGDDITADNPFPVDIPGFKIPNYDEIVLTYVSAGNGAGEIETVTYKLATVTQATLTLSYDANNKLSGVVKS